MIKTILWDVDGTLLNFSKSEKFCILRCLEEIGFYDCDDEMISRYAKINTSYWEVEAIMWHCYSKKSHAYSAAMNFYKAPKSERDAVVKFLRSI